MRLETDRLALVGASTADPLVEQEIKWLNDKEVVRYSEQRHKTHTFASQYSYINSFQWPDMLWEIWVKQKEAFAKFIGTFSVYVDMPNKVADLGIMIGDKDEWGKGYGLEAWTTMIKSVFKLTDVTRVTGGCMDMNTPMHKIMLRSGMQFSGSLDSRLIFGGQRVDILFFGIDK